MSFSIVVLVRLSVRIGVMDLIGTSINIEKNRLNRFMRAAEMLGMSETELLSILLERSRMMMGDKAVKKQPVRYQRGCDEADYVIHHINFIDVDYEFATGRRYLFKISVSFLIRLAIDFFLNEIIQKWLQKPAESTAAREKYITNFHYLHFDIHHSFDSDSEFWLIPWPRGEEKEGGE